MRKPSLTLYSMATPNGQKIGIALEEMGLAYTPVLINIREGQQKTPEFLAMNANGKIPVLVDSDTPDGEPLILSESGAILMYLAEKSGQFLSSDFHGRMATMQWLFFQMAGLGPMFGQFGHFTVFADQNLELSYPIERFKNESTRILGVLNDQLGHSAYIAGEEMTIADMATLPWLLCLDRFYKASDTLNLAQYKHITHWQENLLAREGVQKGLTVNALP